MTSPTDRAQRAYEEQLAREDRRGVMLARAQVIICGLLLCGFVWWLVASFLEEMAR